MSSRSFDTLTIIPLVDSFTRSNLTNKIVFQTLLWSKQYFGQPPEVHIPHGMTYIHAENRKDKVYSSDLYISPMNDHLTYTSPLVSNERYAGVEKEGLCMFLDQVSRQIFETMNHFEEKEALGAWERILGHALRVGLKIQRDLSLQCVDLSFKNNLLVDYLENPTTIGSLPIGSPDVRDYFQKKFDKEESFVHDVVKKYYKTHGPQAFAHGIDEIATMGIEVYERQKKECGALLHEHIYLHKN